MKKNLLAVFFQGNYPNKGLNFVRATKQADEFSVKQGIERFMGCVELQDFRRDHEIKCNKLEKDIF